MEGFSLKTKGAVILFFLVLLVFALATLHTSDSVYGKDSAIIEKGKKVYKKYCIICHGEKGDGKGLIGIIHRVEKSGLVWYVYPRDFTVGVFKFRSTPTGCLPTDDDLLRTITNGIPRSGMPSHKDLSLEERKAVIAYIKTFSKRWVEEEPCDEVIEAKMPKWVGTPESVKKGEKIYVKMKCWECHGYEGKGDGPKSDKLKDDWGDKILPFDFTTGTLKRGSSPENIYMTYITGLDGTGMPSYEDSIPNEEDRWHLVSYTLKLMKRVK
ncbi:MAG TPA: c-type cytochrome [Nitrospirae bacterium]|nr:c-type cytochrome [Nitrospirota bacterium]